MKNTKSAFTLVELIVVITILAILGTIAFISLQGYSADARNSKRTTDLSNIGSSLNIKLTTGMSIMSLVGDSTSALTTISVGGETPADYDAGVVNYAALGMKASEFLDPNDNSYVAGASEKAGGVYQLASNYEGENGLEAKVAGNYTPRTASGSNNAVTLTGTNEADATSLTMSGATQVGILKAGDVTDLGTIKKISDDGMTFTLLAAGLAVGANEATITLFEDETLGLIADLEDEPIIDGGDKDNLPY